ncbi:unnamed protein product [Schistocephalus solidus]|uniref:GRIP domain-containing protein n=1 Tax=Schistocephalus solidus TaxID=70667 RepID=A0A183T5Y5_SCHSO|nr:unnamed protein product [Schistocephalus solidus]
MRNKEEALETSRLLLETERTKTILGIQELSARSAALENQLQQCTSELKRVNQRNHVDQANTISADGFYYLDADPNLSGAGWIEEGCKTETKTATAPTRLHWRVDKPVRESRPRAGGCGYALHRLAAIYRWTGPGPLAHGPAGLLTCRLLDTPASFGTLKLPSGSAAPGLKTISVDLTRLLWSLVVPDLEFIVPSEFGTLLTSLQKERSQLLELDRQKSKVIDSLNYQFLELNAEKQRLAETVLAAKTSTQGRVSELQARLATVETELAKAVQEVTSHRRRADVLAVELEELRACLATQSQEQQQQQQQQPTCSAEVSSTSAPMTADEVAAATSEEPLRLDDAAPAVVGTAAKELVYSKSGPNKAKDQQALLQTTLVNTENTLARLQRSIEEEEAKWRHLLLESEKRNANLKRQLEAIKTNSVKAEDGLSDLDGDLDDDSLVAVDSPLTPEGRLNGSHRHQKTMDASL